MKIWIDADAAPRAVKEIVFRASRRLNLEVTLVANQTQANPSRSSLVTSITVRDGANEADRYIAESAEANDLVISADVPLAAILVAKGVIVIDPRGEVYTADNVQSRLSTRDFYDHLRGAGAQLQGNRPYNDKDKAAFAAALDRQIAKASRNNPLHRDTKNQPPG